MKKWVKKGESEERRKSVLIRGLEMKERKRKETVEEIMKLIGMELKVEEVWKIADDKEKGREFVGVNMEKEEKRREIWEKKKAFRGRKQRIVEDWAWQERKMRWNLERIAREEEGKGREVWIGYGKIRINGQWWKWDEEKETLKNGWGRKRIEQQRRGEEEKRVTER